MKNLTTLCFLILVFASNAQDSLYKSVEVGIRSKKYTGFYWENGITAEFYSAKITGKFPLHFGMNFTFSALGSAFHSNALSMTNIDGFAAYYFRHNKKFQPNIRLNVGYVHTDLGSFANYHEYHNAAMVVGLEAGFSYQLPYRFRICTSGGYNFFVGNESSSLGSSVYPVFGQISILYAIKNVYR